MFDKLVEFPSNAFTTIPRSNLALPSLGWQFSTPAQSGGEISFTITSTSSKGRFSSLVFRNHLIMNGSTNSADLTKVKFDIVLKSYQWVSTDTSARLGLRFKLKDLGNPSGSVSQNGATLTVGNAYFSADTSSGISVHFDGSDPNSVWLVYDHFTSDLEHDPTFGVQASGICWAFPF